MYYYCIAQNFRESKFSKIAIFEDFIEIILRICCTCTLHTAGQKFSLKYFRKQSKFREIKDLRKFSAIWVLYLNRNVFKCNPLLHLPFYHSFPSSSSFLFSFLPRLLHVLPPTHTHTHPTSFFSHFPFPTLVICSLSYPSICLSPPFPSSPSLPPSYSFFLLPSSSLIVHWDHYESS